MTTQNIGLVGDIGATNTRLGLVRPDGGLDRVRVLATDDYPGLGEAIAAYLAEEAPSGKLAKAVMAVAAPVTGDEVTMTNHPWTFSGQGLRQRFGFERVRVINDFVGNALAVPQLGKGDVVKIGSGEAAAGAPIGVIGPGSGLGVSMLVRSGGDDIPIHSEGGHVTMAAADAREAAVLDLMRRRFDHVSAERFLSGPGLVNIYNTLCELSGTLAAPLSPAQITDVRIGEQDRHAREATAMFCAMLGTVAGNLALTLGARAGIYVTGGIVPRLGAVFEHSEFRSRFESKGRMSGYVAAIPTYVIVHASPALVGAARLLRLM
jgi:glucokinase